jgi:anaerobic selenocysteine-containing dehydrogenase
MKVRVEEGRLVSIDPHPGNRATPEGPCLKGLSYLERVYSPERILHPLRRKPDGGFERIQWDDAFDLMAERLTKAKAKGGPQSVLYYAGSGTKGLLNGCGLAFWRLFGGCTTTYGDLCWPTGLEATRLTLGDNRANAPWDLAHARLIVMWGKNAAETNLHQMRFVEQALERGATFIVIDPRRTQTSERAHLLVQPKPGTDGALALGLAHLIIQEGLVDRDFIEAHVHGYEAFARSVEPWTPDRTEAVTDVPAVYIRRLAEDLGRVKPATICVGFGMQRYTNSGQTIRAILALLAITGNIGKPGAGWIYANLATQIFGSVKDPLDCYPPEEQGAVRVSVSVARLGRDMLAQRNPELSFAWVERGNPVSQNPETSKVLEAFRRLDFRVVVDERLTDTAREADLVLPSKSLFEQSDVIGAYWHGYLQLRQKVIQPPGEVKPESEIYRGLGLRLGMPQTELDAILPGVEDDAVEAWLQSRLDPFGITLDQLREGPVTAPGMEEIAFADGVFPTPSGKIELVSEEAVTRWNVDALPSYREPGESTASGRAKYPLQLLSPNTKNGIHSQFLTLQVIRQFEAGPMLFMGPEDAATRGLRAGDDVRVFNDRGELRLPLKIDFGLRAGVVIAVNGWELQNGGTVNLLSEGRETDMGHGAAFHDNVVNVEKSR